MRKETENLLDNIRKGLDSDKEFDVELDVLDIKELLIAALGGDKAKKKVRAYEKGGKYGRVIWMYPSSRDGEDLAITVAGLIKKRQ